MRRPPRQRASDGLGRAGKAARRYDARALIEAAGTDGAGDARPGRDGPEAYELSRCLPPRLVDLAARRFAAYSVWEGAISSALHFRRAPRAVRVAFPTLPVRGGRGFLFPLTRQTGHAEHPISVSRRTLMRRHSISSR